MVSYDWKNNDKLKSNIYYLGLSIFHKFFKSSGVFEICLSLSLINNEVVGKNNRIDRGIEKWYKKKFKIIELEITKYAKLLFHLLLSVFLTLSMISYSNLLSFFQYE